MFASNVFRSLENHRRVYRVDRDLMNRKTFSSIKSFIKSL